ncbi:MAG TPA: hypothetical protein VF841_04455 [Anaeromyxobacter sp.]
MRLRTLLPLAAIASACARAPLAPPAPPQAPADYYPLAVGNEWVYRDASPALPADRQGTSRTVRILERTKDGYWRDSAGAELRADADCLHDRDRRLLCAPLAAGKSWSSVVSVSSTERYEIVAVGEKVATPAGTFDGCVRVRARNRASPTNELVNELTFAPGVGLVRIETAAVLGGKVLPQARFLLERYRVGRR